MNLAKNIFFIGPASVGKTTIGSLLAKKLRLNFVDIDAEFNKRIMLIPHYIKSKGYSAYCETNSSLVDILVQEHPQQTVFATPSGFLVHKESPHLVTKHLELIKTHAISILLLPSYTPEESVQMIVDRQLARWNDITADYEREKFIERFPKYKQYGDIQIISMEKPEVIVSKVLDKLGSIHQAQSISIT